MKTSVIKRLPLLSGVAIIAIVVNHAASWGHYAMFLWADRYRPVSVPNWDQIGSIPYYVLMVLKQLPVFSVPAFIFISGFFIAYSVRGNQRTVSYKLVRNRLVYLIIPYLIWSITIFARDSLFRGEKNPPLWYLSTLLIGKASSSRLLGKA
jgi:surface polysaccharide O-acyltransferase-like enzyme